MSEKKEKKERQGRRDLLILLLLLLIVICLGVTIWALFFRDSGSTNPSGTPLIPDYAPKETEPNAVTIPGESDDKLTTPEGGGAIGIEYINKVTIDLSDGMAYLSYANPGKSTQNTVLRIEIQDVVIVQSGTITPGHRVNELPLLDGAADVLQPGVYESAVFRILSYDPETGEKAMVDTIAQIVVNVQE